MLILLILFTGAIRSGSWALFLQFKDPHLQSLAKQLPSLLQHIKQPNTIKTYLSAYKNFENWTQQHKELEGFPTSPHAICLYLMHLAQAGKAWSTIRTNIAGISWLHKFNGHNDPASSELVKAVLDSIKSNSLVMSNTKGL